MHNGRGKPWHNAIDPDYCYWRNHIIHRILKNETYIGSVIANTRKVVQPGINRCAMRPKSEWIITPNSHESLVSKEDFEKAQLVTVKKRSTQVFEKLFIKKIKCPSCGHTMVRYNVKNPRFKCGTAQMTDRYGCQTYNVLQSEIEAALLPAIKAHIELLIDHEEMKLAGLEKLKVTAKNLETKVATEKRAIETLESSVTKLFTDFAMGKMDQDMFIQKKLVINERIDKKNHNIENWIQELQRIASSQQASAAALSELSHWGAVEKLDKEIVSLLVDKIYIHGERDVEIIWSGTFGNDNTGADVGTN